MKRLILLISLLFLIGLAGFVLADNFNIHYKIYANEGWNLLQGFGAYSLVSNFVSGGDVTNSDVVAIFVYMPNNKKYARVYPNPEVKVDDKILLNNVFWVYLKKSGWIEYSVEEEWAFSSNRQLVAGWNFVGLTKDLYQVKLKDMKGNCNVEKIGSYQREWRIGNASGYEDVWLADTEQDIGKGIVMKVSNNCNLATLNGGVTPPSIPLIREFHQSVTGGVKE